MDQDYLYILITFLLTICANVVSEFILNVFI